jgi:hypothetical protein
MVQDFIYKDAHFDAMSTTLKKDEVVKEEAQMVLLPLCEANRDLVLRPDVYVSNAVFTVGALRLIDKAP